MTKDDRFYLHRIALFAHDERVGASKACADFKVHRATYYRWRTQVARFGLRLRSLARGQLATRAGEDRQPSGWLLTRLSISRSRRKQVSAPAAPPSGQARRTSSLPEDIQVLHPRASPVPRPSQSWGRWFSYLCPWCSTWLLAASAA